MTAGAQQDGGVRCGADVEFGPEFVMEDDLVIAGPVDRDLAGVEAVLGGDRADCLYRVRPLVVGNVAFGRPVRQALDYCVVGAQVGVDGGELVAARRPSRLIRNLPRLQDGGCRGDGTADAALHLFVARGGLVDVGAASTSKASASPAQAGLCLRVMGVGRGFATRTWKGTARA